MVIFTDWIDVSIQNRSFTPGTAGGGLNIIVSFRFYRKFASQIFYQALRSMAGAIPIAAGDRQLSHYFQIDQDRASDQVDSEVAIQNIIENGCYRD